VGSEVLLASRSSTATRLCAGKACARGVTAGAGWQVCAGGKQLSFADSLPDALTQAPAGALHNAGEWRDCNLSGLGSYGEASMTAVQSAQATGSAAAAGAMEVRLGAADGPEAGLVPGTLSAAPAAARAAAAAGVPAAVASAQPAAAEAAHATADNEAGLAESARFDALTAAAAGAVRAAAGARPALPEASFVTAEAVQPQAWPGAAAGAGRTAAGAPAWKAAPPGEPAEPQAAGTVLPRLHAAGHAAADTPPAMQIDAPPDAQTAAAGVDADAGAARAARLSAWGPGVAVAHAEAAMPAAGMAAATAAAEPNAAQAARPLAWAVADADAPGAAPATSAAAGQADRLQPAASPPAGPPQLAGDEVHDALTLPPRAPLAEHAASRAVGGAAQVPAEGRDAEGAPRSDDEEGAAGGTGLGEKPTEARLQGLAAAPLAGKADAAGGGAWRLGKGLGVPDWEAGSEARHGLIGAGPPAGAEHAGAAGRARALPAICVKAADEAAPAAALPVEPALVPCAMLAETRDALLGANEPTRAVADAPDDPSPAPPDSDLPACESARQQACRGGSLDEAVASSISEALFGSGALDGASAPLSPCADDGDERAAALGRSVQAAVGEPGALPEAPCATHGGAAHATQPEPEHDPHEATCAVLTSPALAADHWQPPPPLPPPPPPRPPPPPPPPLRLPGARHTSLCAPTQWAGGGSGAGRREQGRLRSATVGGAQTPGARPARSCMQPSPCPDRLSDGCGQPPGQPAAPLAALAGTGAADPGAATECLRPGSGAAAAHEPGRERDQAPADGGAEPAAGEPQHVPRCKPERVQEDGQHSPTSPRFRPLHWVQAPCIAGSVWAQLGAGAPAGTPPGGPLPPAAARALRALFSAEYAGAASVSPPHETVPAVYHDCCRQALADDALTLHLSARLVRKCP